MKSITGSFAASGNKTVTEVTQFSAAAGTAYNDFQIEQNVIDEESGTGTTYKCVIYRVGERLINNIGPGFTIINKTANPLQIHIQSNQKFYANGDIIQPKVTKSWDANSGWQDIITEQANWNLQKFYTNVSDNLITWAKEQATQSGNNPDSLLLGTKDNGKLFSNYTVQQRNKAYTDYSRVSWISQYSGATQLFSTSSAHPTYEVSGGYYYDKVLNQIVLTQLCITKKNDYGTGNAGDQKCTTD